MAIAMNPETRKSELCIRRKKIGADISRRQACPHAALYQEKIPEHLVFRKAESKRPFNPLLSLFELNLLKSLERKQEKSNPKLLANKENTLRPLKQHSRKHYLKVLPDVDDDDNDSLLNATFAGLLLNYSGGSYIPY